VNGSQNNRYSKDHQGRSRVAWLDVFAILAWGGLLLKYWLTQKLTLLIHPDYVWLSIAGGIGLLVIGLWRALQLLNRSQVRPTAAHYSLLPKGWGSSLLLVTALVGLLTTPKVFASQAAFQRGISDSAILTRTNPQSFRTAKRPEERNLIEWIRTLNVYPEPDHYIGEKVNVQGFVIHPPNLPDQYLMISRFILTCCAADAYPVGLPVKLMTSRSTHAPDTWLQIEGEMQTEVLEDKRKLTIVAQKITPISEPQNPYEY
jgi:uncharacterized repeat protein (TIGR03943 family)